MAKGLYVPPRGQLLALTVHGVQLIAVVVVTRVGVFGEDVLWDLLERMISKLSFACGIIAFVGLLHARSAALR